jgi:hypothetical protein
MAFTPKFVDLVRNFTTVQGTGPVVVGAAVSGYTGLAQALGPGDQFYYCLQSVDKPQEREVGRGTLQADGKVAREPVSGGPTDFSGGTKTIALVAAAEWFAKLEEVGGNGGQAPTTAASRSALAASPPAEGPKAAILAEAPREGLFLFDSSDLSAAVAADVQRAIYIAPTADLTGASGAWVRKFDGPVNPAWFGIVEGDAGGANGAGNSAAMAAMWAALAVRGVIYNANHRGLDPVRFGPGLYEFDDTIDIADGQLIFEGANGGGYRHTATELKFPAGVTGIRVQGHNTSGAIGPSDGSHYGGFGSAIRNLAIRGGYAGAGVEGEYHGIQLRGCAEIRNVFIEGFEGDGIHAQATAGSGTIEGNVNRTQIIQVRIEDCRNGAYFNGSDANICYIESVDCTSCRQWGFWESGFLGNTYMACHSSGCGTVPGSHPPSVATQGGNRYTVVAGQEVGASTNAPSGTTADNTWWYYLGAGAADATQNIAAWLSGTTYRAGGSYHSDGAGAFNQFIGCYQEGTTGIAQFSAPTLVLLGKMGAYKGDGAVITGAASGYVNVDRLRTVSTFRAEGTSVFGSTTSGTNLAVNFENGNSSNTLLLRSTVGGSTQTDGTLITSRNSGMTLRGYGVAGAQGNVNLASGTTIVARSKATGFNVLSGFSYQHNDLQVVGARKTGWAPDTGIAKRSANATYAAGAALAFGAAYDQAEHSVLSARLVAVEATLQDASQTIKALKDDLHANAGHGLIGA